LIFHFLPHDLAPYDLKFPVEFGVEPFAPYLRGDSPPCTSSSVTAQSFFVQCLWSVSGAVDWVVAVQDWPRQLLGQPVPL